MSYVASEGDLIDVYARHGRRNLGVITQAEGEKLLAKMQFFQDNTRSASYASTGFLEGLRTGTYFDMWKILNARKDGLDHEALGIWEGFEKIDPIEPYDIENYYPRYELIYLQVKAMRDLLEKISADPKAYFDKYDEPELWDDFLEMTLVKVPKALAKGAGGAISELGWTIVPLAAVGLLGLYVFYKIKKGD